MEQSNNKIHYILICLSLIFLLVFLSLWNVDNYKSEKEELKNRLSQQMTLACSAYRDSIVQNIFQVLSIQRDPNANLIQAPKFPGHSHDSTYFETLVFSTNMNKDKRDLSISVQFTDTTKSTSQHNHHEMFLDVQERFIAWRSDSADRFSFDIPSDSTWKRLERDTSLVFPHLDFNKSIVRPSLDKAYLAIDSIFSLKLLAEQLPLDHSIIHQGSDLKKNTEGLNIEFEYETFNRRNEGPPVAYFDSFTPYLLNKIATPLVASLFLFTLVALSFYFIISKWKEEERSSKIRRAFMSNMTHELKTPLATVGIALEALDNYDVIEDKQKSREYLDISRKEIGRLGMLVDKVLKMTALENELGELQEEEIELKTFLNEIISSMRVYFENTSTSVECHIEDQLANIKGDKIHLTNAIYNLIDNAIKYSEDNPLVKLDVKQVASDIYISISDKGKGIPPAYQKKVFERLFRIPTDDIHDTKGYGLGLHYVDEVIKQHNGHVALESVLGKGSTFTIKLPIAS